MSEISLISEILKRIGGVDDVTLKTEEVNGAD